MSSPVLYLCTSPLSFLLSDHSTAEPRVSEFKANTHTFDISEVVENWIPSRYEGPRNRKEFSHIAHTYTARTSKNSTRICLYSVQVLAKISTPRGSAGFGDLAKNRNILVASSFLDNMMLSRFHECTPLV